MTRDIVERLKETAIMLPRSGYVSVGHEAAEAADEITALRARLEAVERERDDLTQRIHAKGGTADYPTMWAYEQAVKTIEKHRARAERAEAALATARRDAELLNKIVLPMVEQRSRDQGDAWGQAVAAIRALANEAKS